MLLLIFYLAVIAADFVAPYDPYVSEPNGSLLPPTRVYWRHPTTEQFVGPHVYLTTQGPTEIETGDRKLSVDWRSPSPLRLLVKGPVYNLFQIRLPLPPSFEEVELFGEFPLTATYLVQLVLVRLTSSVPMSRVGISSLAFCTAVVSA